MGLARFQSNLRRFSMDKDSGRIKYPYRKLMNVRAAAAIKGMREPYSPKIPPTTGPIINPNPNAAPTRPKFCARFSGVEISAM